MIVKCLRRITKSVGSSILASSDFTHVKVVEEMNIINAAYSDQNVHLDEEKCNNLNKSIMTFT